MADAGGEHGGDYSATAPFVASGIWGQAARVPGIAGLGGTAFGIVLITFKATAHRTAIGDCQVGTRPNGGLFEINQGG